MLYVNVIILYRSASDLPTVDEFLPFYEQIIYYV